MNWGKLFFGETLKFYKSLEEDIIIVGYKVTAAPYEPLNSKHLGFNLTSFKTSSKLRSSFCQYIFILHRIFLITARSSRRI